MDWMRTNDSPQSAWEDRPVPEKAFYGDASGVPLEVMVALSNRLNTDVWFNMPHRATDDYVAKFAAAAHRSLVHKQRVYVEYSNETWNGIFKQTSYMTARGRAMWPSAPSDVSVNRSFYGMRTSQICEMWKRVWGADASRVVCVMSTQTVNYGVATSSLDCSLWEQAPCSTNHGIDALAITGYIGGSIPSSWSSQQDGGLDYLFTQILQGGIDPKGYPGGFIKEFSDLTAANKKIADAHGLELVFYEGGWGFVAPGDAGLTALFLRANKDPRVGQVYTALLEAWKTSGGHIFNQFVAIGTSSKWGCWGALENVIKLTLPSTIR